MGALPSTPTPWWMAGSFLTELPPKLWQTAQQKVELTLSTLRTVASVSVGGLCV